MADINTFFSKEDKNRINEAVKEAEKSTSAEIVPVLTDASGGYDRAEDLFGLISALVCTAVLWMLFQGIDHSAAWTTGDAPSFTYNLAYVILTVAGVFVLGAATASKIWFIRHLFAPRSLMKKNVARGAQRAFYEYGLTKTGESTGICIYISLFERMVHVLGDVTISEKLNNSDFEEVKDAIINGFKKTEIRAEGLCKGINLCGKKCAEHFPVKDDDVNELPNTLRIWEQNL
jgi:putative membrane protein